jgi:hypothetical protein
MDISQGKFPAMVKACFLKEFKFWVGEKVRVFRWTTPKTKPLNT